MNARFIGALAVAALLALSVPAGAAAKPKIQPPDRSRVGKRPVRIRDGRPTKAGQRLLKKGTLRSQGISGGDYDVGNGETVRILESPSYDPDPGFDQSWADFFASLLHDWELSSVTVYFAPYEEVTTLCSVDADACYYPQSDTIILPGSDPPDGEPLEEVAIHEYGHQVGNNRDNSPWDGMWWGTKRWASYEGVCPRVRAGTAFPGDEGELYALNPGEAFAESYRVVNGGQFPWGIVDDSWYPDPTDQDLITADVLNPYTGPTTRSWTGNFKRGSTNRTRYANVATPLDGTFVVRLHSHGTLNGDLYVYDASDGSFVAKRATTARSETLRTTVCGPAKIEVDVYRRAGWGSFSFDVTRP